MIYFAYGSNMDSQQMAVRCPGAENLGIAALRDYRIFVNSNGVLSITSCRGEIVWGVLWRITPAAQESLDCYEGVSIGVYRWITVTVEDLNMEQITAFCYEATNTVPGEPAQPYAKKVLLAGITKALPGPYIAALASLLHTGEHLRAQDSAHTKLVLFVYGTLKQGFSNHDLLAGATYIGRAKTVEKYAMYGFSVPSVVLGQQISLIFGEAYYLSREILRQLDKIEGYPVLYQRAVVPIELAAGLRVRAWIYVTSEKRGELIPGGEFVNR